MSEEDVTEGRTFTPGELVSGRRVGGHSRSVGKFVRMHTSALVVVEDPQTGTRYPMLAETTHRATVDEPPEVVEAARLLTKYGITTGERFEQLMAAFLATKDGAR